MNERPEVIVLAEIYDRWYSVCATWRPTAGEQFMCRDCEHSLFAEASGLRGIAPHSILHDLCMSLESATVSVAGELWLACDRCDATDADADECAHEMEARIRLFDQMALSSVDLISAVEALARGRAGWEREYAVRRLDEFLHDSSDWRPSTAMLSAAVCSTCQTHPLRGEASIRRLPHDLRHDLFTIIDQIEDEFADPSSPNRNATVSRSPSGTCGWARALMLGLVVESRLGLGAFVEAVVDSARAQWIVDHQPLTVEHVAREISLAMARPTWESQLEAKIREVVLDAPALLSSGWWRSTEHAYRSPYALAACPDLHWPASLIAALVTIAVDVRGQVCGMSGGDTMATFDAWMFERLRSLPLMEHRLATTIERRHGEAHRRRLGLRLLSPIDDSIVVDLS